MAQNDFFWRRPLVDPEASPIHYPETWRHYASRSSFWWEIPPRRETDSMTWPKMRMVMMTTSGATAGMKPPLFDGYVLCTNSTVLHGPGVNEVCCDATAVAKREVNAIS